MLLMVFFIITICSAALIAYTYIELQSTSESLSESERQSQISEATLSQINATAPRVSIALNFTPMPVFRIIPTNTVTYLTAVVTATNLTDLFYPCTMLVLFNVNHTTSNPNANIKYSFVTSQRISLIKGVQRVEIPWGVFPLACYNMNLGDVITLVAVARVIITWEPVGSTMTDQLITTSFTIQIGG
jgi:hypothetical protein